MPMFRWLQNAKCGKLAGIKIHINQVPLCSNQTGIDEPLPRAMIVEFLPLVQVGTFPRR